MAKSKPITQKELIDAINAEGLGVGHPYESELDLATCSDEKKRAQLPGTIGTARTANDAHWMTYVVDENRHMTMCSVHDTQEEAYGMALRRYRDFAKEEGYVKPEGDSFQYGPISNGEYARQYAEQHPDASDGFGKLDGVRCHVDKKFYEKQENWGDKPSFWANKITMGFTTSTLPNLGDPAVKSKLTEQVTEVLKANCEDVSKIKLTKNEGTSINIECRSESELQVRPMVHQLSDALNCQLEDLDDALADLNQTSGQEL